MLALTVGLLKCFCGRMVGGATMRPGKRTRIISELDWSSRGSRLRRWITAVTAAVLISVPAVAQTGAYPGQLPVGKECDTKGEAYRNCRFDRSRCRDSSHRLGGRRQRQKPHPCLA